MPDWITHIGFNTCIFLPVKDYKKNFVLFLIGAVLPDAMKTIWVQLIDFSSLSYKVKEFLIWYFEPFHTPFYAIFLSSIVAILIKGNYLKNFIIIFLGTLLHFFLDSTQIHFSFYQLLLYPFSFKNFNLQIFHTSEKIYFFASIVSLIVILILIIKNWNSRVEFVIRYKGILILMILFMLIFPFFTKKNFYKSNFNSLLFLNSPKDWENRKVELGVSYISDVKDNSIIVEEIGRKFKVIVNQGYKFKKGEFISVRGTYKNNNIYPEIILKEPLRAKKYFSLAGFLIVLIFIIKSLIYQWFNNGFRKGFKQITA